jgi:cytoskeletal protein RodZ
MGIHNRSIAMNLKAHLPIIALCGLTFLVSFAAGLWWEIAQQDEWAAPDTQQSIAKRKAVTDKPKSDQEEKSDTEEEKVAADGKDEPDTPAEDAESPPSETTPEPGVAPNISPAAVPGNALRVRDGLKGIDLSNMSPEDRARFEQARQRALETAARARATISTVEISGEPVSTVTITSEGPAEVEVIVEPDNE